MPRVLQPTHRNAILVNNYDRFAAYTPSPLLRGNRRIYELEALLKGSLGKQDTDMQSLLSRQFCVYELSVGRKRIQKVSYDSVFPILPSAAMKDTLLASIDTLAQTSDENSLTLVYITSHGSPGGFSLDDDHMPYRDLLQQLDRISGKKVLVVIACYSGSLLDVSNPESQHYVIATSTKPQEPGTNYGDDEIHESLAGIISAMKPLHLWQLPKEVGVTHKHHPQRIGDFSVVL